MNHALYWALEIQQYNYNCEANIQVRKIDNNQYNTYYEAEQY